MFVGNNTTTGAIAGNVTVQSGASFRFDRSDDYTYSGVISGAGDVWQYGGSNKKLTLNGVNTYTGSTIVSWGTLALGINGTIENSSEVSLAFSTSKFDISAGNKKIKKIWAVAPGESPEVILGSRTLTIGTAGQNDGTSFFNGFFSGTGGVTKTGTANLVIQAANHPATGTFTLNGGTLDFNGKWSGNFIKNTGTTINVHYNAIIGGNLIMEGGIININLTNNPPNNLTVNGTVSASGTNTLGITSNPVTDCVLIQSASGLNSTTPFTVDLPGLYSGLTATGTQLLLTASTTPLTPTITTTTLPDGLTGAYYTENLTATGLTPITWSFEGGMLPPGLTLAANGVISGTPTAEGTFNFMVKATNGIGNAVAGLSIKVNASTTPPQIVTNNLPAGVTGTAYSAPLEATGTAPITWSLASGNLPNGLTLSSAGVISGTPTAAGTFNFTVQATNSAGSDTKALAITITAPPVITTTTLPDGLIGAAYTANLAATGDTPITWSLENGSLPNGLTLSSAGAISGTPTAEGIFNFTVKATNNAGSAIKPLAITVTTSAVAPTITTNTLPNGATTVAYSAELEATGTAPIMWSLASGNLPTGLTLYSGGTISGTPTAVGTFNFTVQASNSMGSDTKALSIKIEDGVGIEELRIENGELRIFPNPTRGKLTIDNGQLTMDNVEVFDVYGRKQKTIINYQLSIINSIDISHLPAGIYFVKIRTEAGEVVKKVVKE